MLPLPPATYAVRRPTRSDLDAVAEFLVAVTVAEFGEPDYSAEDLREEWAELDLGTDAWLVTAPEGQIAGYISTSHRGHVRVDADGYVHPAHEGQGIGTFLVRVTEARAREHVPLAPSAARVVLNNGVNGRNPRARALLEREGFAAARHFWRMVLDLDQPPPAPLWPAGISIRTRASEADDRAVYAVIEDAFAGHWGHVPTSFDAWRKRRQGDRFDPELWFLAENGDEAVGAALCSSYLDMGWIDSLGVLPAWRHRGLGLALLRHAFAAFRQRDWPRAALGVDAANETGATRLYERAGMRVHHQYAIYQKELRPGVESPAEEDAG